MDSHQEAKTPSYDRDAAPATETHAVVAKVPQGYDANINIRIVPGRDIQIVPLQTRCAPRQGAPRRDAPVQALPEALVRKLTEANKRVTEWLSKDPANAQAFLARPVEALLKAGIDLTRAEQKELDRGHRTASDERMMPPGVRLAQLSVTASAKGRVGDQKPRPKKKPEGGDCGCDESGKKE